MGNALLCRVARARFYCQNYKAAFPVGDSHLRSFIRRPQFPVDVAFQKVATLDQVKPGKPIAVEVNGEQIALYNLDGTIYATSGVCPHAGGPLAEGDMQGNIVTCPLHGWQFEADSGRCLRIPAMKLKTYKVKVEGNDILVGTG